MKTGEMICLNLSAVWGLKAYLLVKPGCVWGRERLRRTVPTLRNDAGGGAWPCPVRARSEAGSRL